MLNNDLVTGIKLEKIVSINFPDKIDDTNGQIFQLDSLINSNLFIIRINQDVWQLYASNIIFPNESNIAEFTCGIFYGNINENTYNFSITGYIDLINNTLVIKRSSSSDTLNRDFFMDIFIPKISNINQ